MRLRAAHGPGQAPNSRRRGRVCRIGPCGLETAVAGSARCLAENSMDGAPSGARGDPQWNYPRREWRLRALFIVSVDSSKETIPWRLRPLDRTRGRVFRDRLTLPGYRARGPRESESFSVRMSYADGGIPRGNAPGCTTARSAPTWRRRTTTQLWAAGVRPGARSTTGSGVSTREQGIQCRKALVREYCPWNQALLPLHQPIPIGVNHGKSTDRRRRRTRRVP